MAHVGGNQSIQQQQVRWENLAKSGGEIHAKDTQDGAPEVYKSKRGWLSKQFGATAGDAQRPVKQENAVQAFDSFMRARFGDEIGTAALRMTGVLVDGSHSSGKLTSAQVERSLWIATNFFQDTNNNAVAKFLPASGDQPAGKEWQSLPGADQLNDQDRANVAEAITGFVRDHPDIQHAEIGAASIRHFAELAIRSELGDRFVPPPPQDQAPPPSPQSGQSVGANPTTAINEKLAEKINDPDDTATHQKTMIILERIKGGTLDGPKAALANLDLEILKEDKALLGAFLELNPNSRHVVFTELRKDPEIRQQLGLDGDQPQVVVQNDPPLPPVEELDEIDELLAEFTQNEPLDQPVQTAIKDWSTAYKSTFEDGKKQIQAELNLTDKQIEDAEVDYVLAELGDEVSEDITRSLAFKFVKQTADLSINHTLPGAIRDKLDQVSGDGQAKTDLATLRATFNVPNDEPQPVQNDPVPDLVDDQPPNVVQPQHAPQSNLSELQQANAKRLQTRALHDCQTVGYQVTQAQRHRAASQQGSAKALTGPERNIFHQKLETAVREHHDFGGKDIPKDAIKELALNALKEIYTARRAN